MKAGRERLGTVQAQQAIEQALSSDSAEVRGMMQDLYAVFKHELSIDEAQQRLSYRQLQQQAQLAAGQGSREQSWVSPATMPTTEQ